MKKQRLPYVPAEEPKRPPSGGQGVVGQTPVVEMPGKFKVGDRVQVTTPHSHYFGLRGEVVKVHEQATSGHIEFLEAELKRGPRRERVAIHTHRVYFDWHELKSA